MLPRPDVAPAVWVGGQAEAVVRLAARSADGWNGWGASPENFRAKAALLREEAERAGRDGPVQATWAGIVVVGEDEAEAKALAKEREAKGIDALGFHGSAEGFAQFLEDLADGGRDLGDRGPGGSRATAARWSGSAPIPALQR